MICRAVALGGAVCVLGIRPYATLASLDDLGYGMLQDAFYAPYTVNLNVSVYTVV